MKSYVIKGLPLVNSTVSSVDRDVIMVSARQGHTPELRRILFSQLSNIKPASRLDDEVIESLLLTCGDSMLLAALDLIDAQEGIYRPLTET